MSAQHTHGPWKWQEGNPTITRHWNGKDCVIATVDWRALAWHEDGNCAGRESGANARLIAAAPDLLEALELLFGNNALQSVCHHYDADAFGRVKGTWGAKAEAKARAAIAKATGGAA